MLYSNNLQSKKTSDMYEQRTLKSPCASVVSLVRMKTLCIHRCPKCDQWKFWTDCVNVQADQNLRWTHMSVRMVSYIAARILSSAMQKKKMCYTNLEWGNRIYYVRFRLTHSLFARLRGVLLVVKFCFDNQAVNSAQCRYNFICVSLLIC